VGGWQYLKPPTANSQPRTSTPLHLHTRQNERSYRLRIIAPRLLRDVVVVRAVAIPPFGIRITAQPHDRDSAVDVHQAVLVDVDEFLEECGVRAAAGRGVLRVDVAEAGGFEEDVGEHR